ncbi:hypothetical protein [Marivirga sp.]|uniref:hypothetical protein n=1 Tax=Marivirga sp. TaxID=2018662 RepID=UPI002D80D953|nr:hypothetical protein [Marivirga sp.]HET8858736.1 hypothetical protein [Marivirga sp.]
MLEGGFELISISNNYQEFKISNVDQLNNEHDYRRYKYVEKYGESNPVPAMLRMVAFKFIPSFKSGTTAFKPF